MFVYIYENTDKVQELFLEGDKVDLVTKFAQYRLFPCFLFLIYPYANNL